ncbi:hypothetical protein [Calycomorphotria hydatis]|nr:hypothetical protein [Calycomorphotria hydatis]
MKFHSQLLAAVLLSSVTLCGLGCAACKGKCDLMSCDTGCDSAPLKTTTHESTAPSFKYTPEQVAPAVPVHPPMNNNRESETNEKAPIPYGA